MLILALYARLHRGLAAATRLFARGRSRQGAGPSEVSQATHHVLTPAIDWRRNLGALWFAQLTAIFGFSFAFPFLPVYLRQLGIHDASSLAVWTGVAGGASGAALAIMSPIWGALADRYGRRSMLIRAMIGGAITVGLIGFARGPLDLVALRLLQGATSGTLALLAGSQLVAAYGPGVVPVVAGAALAGAFYGMLGPVISTLIGLEAPPQVQARVFGVGASATAVGFALGPLTGGILASRLGVSAAIAICAVFAILLAVVMATRVREPAR